MRFLRWIGLGPRGAVAALTDTAGKPLNFLRPLALVSDSANPQHRVAASTLLGSITTISRFHIDEHRTSLAVREREIYQSATVTDATTACLFFIEPTSHPAANSHQWSLEIFFAKAMLDRNIRRFVI